MISISLSQINYVLALEKTGSFSEAADACFITQSTLSTMIKKLELAIGYQIFDRQSKPIRLTNEGKAFVTQVRVIGQEFTILEEIIQETKEIINGTLSVGIIPTLAPFLLPLFLDSLVSAYPEINFHIHEITTDEIIDRLHSRILDIGILSVPINDKSLIQKSLFKEDFLIYDTSEKTKINRKFKIKEIDTSRLWLLEESHCLTYQIEKICHLEKKRTIGKNLIYNSGSIISLLELVNKNQGITLLPRLATTNKKLIDPKYLHNLENPVPAREIGIVTHSNFVKKRILAVIEKKVVSSVKPYLSKIKRFTLIPPN